LKIGIITNPIDEGIPSHTVYIHNLIKNLNILDKENEYYMIHHTKMDLDIYRSNKEIIIPQPSFKPLRGIFWRYVILPQKLKKLDVDLVHDPRGIGILSFDMPFKKVITIHDLSSLLYPSINIGGMCAHKLLGAKTIKNVDKVITISECTKRDVMKYLKAPEEKVKVIYNGKDEGFKPVNQKEVDKFKQKYNLDFSFILYVGVLQPRKNIPTLIKAYYKLKKEGIKHKLVIAGGKGWQYKKIFETVEKLNLQKDVIFIGHIPDDDIPKLYNAADLFAFPSIYEGFGLPPLEAMACETPVVTSNSSSLPEVVGDAGIMVNPYDVDGLSKAMYEVLTNEGLRADMVKKGLERAKMFSWEKCAKEVLEVYEEAINRR
jgi:glycosyltransferase involved in cell wall biosynthesis